MTRFLSLTFACTLAVFLNLARAQQIDVAVGGSTTFSSKSNSASGAYLPPPQKGGVYTGFSADVILHNHFGVEAEGSWRYKEGLYDGYQRYRPILYDINGLYTHRYGKKINADFLAGVGGESLLFYNRFGDCTVSTCAIFVNSNHFLIHAGGDLRYYVWRRFFVRPELHYYRIVDNHEFHSGNLFRAGASIGYTFGSR